MSGLSRMEQALFGVALVLLFGITLVIQYGLIEDDVDRALPSEGRHDPDYYVENFVAVGMDEQGNRIYELEADRMVHYPDDDTALLDNPHVIQYQPGQAPKHTYSKSGWVSPNGDEILLTDDVRVIQGYNPDDAGGVITTEKMRVFLKQKPDKS